MSQTNLRISGGRIRRDRPIAFTFNGHRYAGYEGDTLASALLANGVDVVGRSFKYSRPRGVMGMGAEESNAIVQLGATDATEVPNVRATQQALYDGLVARSTNGWPNVNFDLMGLVGALAHRLMPPGFYYKTFMRPAFLWQSYETLIRKAAGMGSSPVAPDVDRYDHMNHSVDVVIVGAGPAGLAAALAAGKTGATVILVDEQEEVGGQLLHRQAKIDGMLGADWVEQALSILLSLPNVTVMARTTATGYHDHNFITLHERVSDHLADQAPEQSVRQRMHRVRAQSVLLATGAIERPLVLANNDVPGCMLASAVSAYIKRYAVMPGKDLVLMTAQDDGYRAAIDWHDAGHKVVAIIDARVTAGDDCTQAARSRGIAIFPQSGVIEVIGTTRVKAVKVAALSPNGEQVVGNPQTLICDTLAMSGGWSPAIHLSCHTGAKPEWREDIAAFVPGLTVQNQWLAGSVKGDFRLADCLSAGSEAGNATAAFCGFTSTDAVPHQWQVDDWDDGPAMAYFHVPHTKATSRAPKQFVDFQTDVTAAGIEMATREGYESIEHVKRYTAMGFGTDQGKTGNINGMAITARALGKTIPETGTTIFRPNYTPVTFGAVVGRHSGQLFDPERYTALHRWHLAREAVFEDVGLWKRPRYFPLAGETMDEAVARECLATRNGVGILDASTLGKIDIQGNDAREFLGRVYTNAWAKLAVGKCRYGLMCGEDGMVFDDGVTACLADNHFAMTTTTGGAARVLEWLEHYHQTEWPDMEVYFTSVTDHWATITLSGPQSRALLAEVSDGIDLSGDAFKYLDWRQGSVAGVPARVFRISFTGELSFEINVQAHYAMHVWEAIFALGDRFGLTPYGTESMHVLRAEKGFIITGQDTDGSVTPFDLGMGWCVSDAKPFSYIGKRGMARQDCIRTDRKQLVGLLTVDPNQVLQEGAQAVDDPEQTIPMTQLGHVTSSYFSHCLQRSIAMGFIRNGHARMGDIVYYPNLDGTATAAEICSPVFLDPEGARQHV